MLNVSVLKGKERFSNLELYRIIVMLSIVAHHYVVNSDLWTVMYNSDMNANYVFLTLFGMWGKTGINSFVLITGYFMCTSKATIYKLLKLVFEIIFYNVVIYFVFVAIGKEDFSIFTLLHKISPINSLGHEFVTGFILFYFFIPFLNILIKNMGRKNHFKLIILNFFIYVIWDFVPTITVTFNYLTWFIVLYFISSYIRLYPYHKYDQNTNFWVKTTVVLILLAMLSVSIGLCLHVENNYRFVEDSNSILAVFIATSSFMLFKSLKIKQSHLINTIAATMFGVLLIHSNSDAMRNWLWKDTFNNIYFYSTPYCWLHAILSVCGVFIICVVIDYCRIRWIEKPILNSVMFNEIVKRLEKIINI